MFSKEKQENLQKRMEFLEVYEKDLLEKFILGRGSGGQKINKTSSCVYLKHIPSGIEIKCQQSRSREENRLFARRKLCEIIESKNKNILSEKQHFIEKIRRQKRKRSKRSKEKMLASKKISSKRKTLRTQIREDF